MRTALQHHIFQSVIQIPSMAVWLQHHRHHDCQYHHCLQLAKSCNWPVVAPLLLASSLQADMAYQQPATSSVTNRRAAFAAN
jgi:hypothetical protein